MSEKVLIEYIEVYLKNPEKSQKECKLFLQHEINFFKSSPIFDDITETFVIWWRCNES
jgi:hypothetical protein